MQQKFTIVFILLGNLGFCLEQTTSEKNDAVNNKKVITKFLFHFNVFDNTIKTEDIQFYEKKSLFAVLSYK